MKIPVSLEQKYIPVVSIHSQLTDSLSTDLRENLTFKHREARPTTLRYHECPHDPANHEQNSYDHFGSTKITVLTLFRKP